MTAADVLKQNSDIQTEFKGVNDVKKYEKLILAKDIGTDYSYKRIIHWNNVIGFLILHIAGLTGFGLIFAGKIMWQTVLWGFIVGLFTTEGVTIGAHRLYAHRSFTAHPILKVILIILQTGAGQNCMYIWVRDHRLHHRYADTDADPHNAKRGFFFSHIGWLMSKKHPLVKDLGRKIDLSDLAADNLVMFQKKYYKRLYFLFGFLIPVLVPIYFLGEYWLYSILVAYAARYILQLNGTWLVNSAAHIYGTRPYDKNLQPVENWFVSMISLGEGWHNYHHAFPWDYKAAELSMHFNQSAAFIRFFEKIGLAYDLKTASPDMVVNRINKTGDGTHYELGNDEARNAVTATGPVHPLNPTYNTTLGAPKPVLKTVGLPLFHENDILKEDDNIIRKRSIGVVN